MDLSIPSRREGMAAFVVNISQEPGGFQAC